MAHYAYLDENNIVTAVIVGKNETDPLPEGVSSWEEYYGAKQCSYNTRAGSHPEGVEKAFRKNYPAIGWSYDSARDAFIPPKPYPSWIIDEPTCLWKAPVEYPGNEEDIFSLEGGYVWKEESLEWVWEAAESTQE